MRITILLLFFLTSILSSCKKNNTSDAEVTLPDATQEGKNTVGCFIDGVPFITSSFLSPLVIPVTASYFQYPTSYYKAQFLSLGAIDARFNLDIAGDIVINKLDVSGPGEYNLIDKGICRNDYSCDGIGYHNAKTNITYFAESGKLFITKLDTVNRIVSGLFNFTGRDSTGDKVEVTEGRFDAKYTN